MATNLIDLVPGTAITLGTNSNTVSFTLKNLANNAFQQSPKFDLGAVLSQEWHVDMTVKFGSAPAAGNTVKVYIGYSGSATAGTDNWGNCTGTDATYAGYSGGTAAQSIQQLDMVGQLILDAYVGPQHGRVGSFMPKNRYVYLIFNNTSGQTTTNVDADHVITLRPVDVRVEAAV